MDALLTLRVLATTGMDLAVALITGMLLAWRWLPPDRRGAVHVSRGLHVGLPIAAALLTLSCCIHFFALTAEFSGCAVRACSAQMPDMLSTHAGTIDAAIFGVSLGLLLMSLVRMGRGRRLAGAALLLAAVVLLRSTTGHAAIDGPFTVSEALQCLHLGSMALWSGAVLVSGLYVLPWLAALEGGAVAGSSAQGWELEITLPVAGFAAYLHRLSRTSTLAVLLILLTGVVKSYRALGGDVRLVRSATWGYVLLAKIVWVSLAVGSGALNRYWLSRTPRWTTGALRRTVAVLRFEAVCMLVVLVLSALLGNLSPPSTP